MENYQVNHHLTFCEDTYPPLTARVINIALTTQEDPLNECRLTLQVSPASYEQIDAHAFFNLNPEFRAPFSNGNFQPDDDIQLEITLQPDLFPQLLEYATTAESVATYLISLSQKSLSSVSPSEIEPTSPSYSERFLNSKNWFALSVKQIHQDDETGYTTFWHYVNPAILNHPETASEQLAEGIINFVTNLTTAKLNATTQDATDEVLKGVSTLFEGFDTWLDNAFSQDNDNDTDDFACEESILATIIAYFTKDDWTFTKLQGQSVLQMAYQGKNGLWNCYAQARETEEQFVFYSIYPELVSEEKRLAIAELLTRLNYGLIIGNFEMDFNDGEIRYKTSIAVEGNILTHQVIKRLVYANVTIMDYYLPGIRAVMDENILPEEAIALIESDRRIL
ncbi:YbjN domain-containing protein [Okeania hirsuta]|uniref:YbjN domain-containing protein n=1 Tax=Okeania hirsuta TaxID=1458930 RepID=A0A3N6RPM5_9CYAN|nr:YbjN domain-containing protein [Okeania hirsuta]RQH53442.1 YbjN domain-containing protein [Okeania hirsuta]